MPDGAPANMLKLASADLCRDHLSQQQELPGFPLLPSLHLQRVQIHARGQLASRIAPTIPMDRVASGLTHSIRQRGHLLASQVVETNSIIQIVIGKSQHNGHAIYAGCSGSVSDNEKTVLRSIIRLPSIRMDPRHLADNFVAPLHHHHLDDGRSRVL